MKQRVLDLIKDGDKLFSKREGLLTVWQSMAENFYPMRADFTTTRSLSDEFASHLMTGRPVLAHRDLGNAISAMLRPKDKTWFSIRTHSEQINEDASARQWLDAKTSMMYRHVYDRRSQFVRATKQGDADFTAFGQCVLSIDPNRDLTGLLYRSWHLKDVAWCENAELQIDVVHRNQNIEARNLIKLFPKTVDKKVYDLAKKDPYKEIKVRHIVMPADEYDYTDENKRKSKHKFVSIFVDCDNQTILEEMPRKRLGYIIPRWVTVAGSQYAYSPATVVALPDARMLQQLTLIVLEAGQKAVDPPMKASREAVAGGVNTMSGGLTWVEADYDERTGAAIEPLMEVSKGLGWGEEREEKIEALINDAFFLSKIGLPTMDGKARTAYEVQKLYEDYVRGAAPLFEPVEQEYNVALCEMSFEYLMDMNAFGPFDDMPQNLRGQDIRFQFDGPLQPARERLKSEAFNMAAEKLAMAAQMDPTARHEFNVPKALRSAIIGGGAPADWLHTTEESEQAREAEQQAMVASQAAEAVSTGAQVAGQVGAGAQQLQAAGLV